MKSVKGSKSLFTSFNHLYNAEKILLFIKLYWLVILKLVIFIRNAIHCFMFSLLLNKVFSY